MRTYYLPPKAPLNAKFGLHFGYFAQLPTVEEFFRFKTVMTEWASCIQELDISAAILSVKHTQGAWLVIEMPFSSLGEDINPSFPYPIAINGYVADVYQPKLSMAHIYAKDLQGQIHPLGLNGMENTDNFTIPLIKTQIKDNLQSLYYCYTKAQIILGNGLYPLPQNNVYKNKLFLCMPDIYIPANVKVSAWTSLPSHSNAQ